MKKLKWASNKKCPKGKRANHARDGSWPLNILSVKMESLKTRPEVGP